MSPDTPRRRPVSTVLGPGAWLRANLFNSWWSSAAALTVTFALPMRDRLPPQELPLIAGLAVRALESR